MNVERGSGQTQLYRSFLHLYFEAAHDGRFPSAGEGHTLPEHRFESCLPL